MRYFFFKRTLQVFGLSLFFVSLGTACAAEDALSAYEHAFFGHSFTGESTSSRLNRLEQSVFGDGQRGTDAQRQERLMNALKLIPQTRQMDASKVESQTTESQAHEQPTAATQTPPPKDATDYPTVTALERSVFGRDFIRDDISVRLSRLEKKTLGAASPQMALVDRVDRLLARQSDPKAARMLRQQNSNSVSPPAEPRRNYRDVYTKVEALEKRFFNQSSNSRLMLTERLEQLEQHAYGKSYSGESVDSRVNRLMAQFVAAKGTGQAMSRGQPQVIYESGGNAHKNVQVGATLNQNSQTQFSQDMLNLLPDDVRSQLQSQSGSGTVLSAPGTVVIRQESSTTTQAPGFQNFGSQPIQYYNYYGAPNTKVQSQTTTTVIQPNGGTVVYGYNTVPNALPNPAYIGDPAFMQQLDAVEANVFGQVSTLLPIQARLSKLEMTILQKTQPQLPEVERLDTIFRAWKIQQISRVIGSDKSTNLGIPLTPAKK